MNRLLIVLLVLAVLLPLPGCGSSKDGPTGDDDPTLSDNAAIESTLGPSHLVKQPAKKLKKSRRLN